MMKNNEKSKFEEEVQPAENEWLRARRQYAGIEQKECADKEKKKDPLKYPDTMGLALSGGGIRSATFNLGLLQALERYGLLKCVDYLSTVSGGGHNRKEGNELKGYRSFLKLSYYLDKKINDLNMKGSKSASKKNVMKKWKCLLQKKRKVN
jgi:hypothetical protein